MFKLIFRTITLIMFLVSLAVGLAFWKGGEPFRVVGEGMVTIGKKVSGVGDIIDEAIKGGKKVKKSYIKIKKIVEPEEEKQQPTKDK
jgi:hypothetical protein